MFGCAKRAYTLLVITVTFGNLVTWVIVEDGRDFRLRNLLCSVALAVSYLLVLPAAPAGWAVR
ncbi:major facilitator superfamily MFS_1 [Thioalkalivibrio nitratireducens DSM 14787]|uniref:Major facilitator superfamily MFS_1 n=1 Tax=Thioalkalivibrio nitratireducens (strain DSM 14787 / UNIQEM 213 / ALEN2) TaxID=1255043 RepID=L0DTZ9_THIND|nr:major facilitator superfamily MFS_1 [Thioalkalivibrio nitratireducens DSM 14787]